MFTTCMHIQNIFIDVERNKPRRGREGERTERTGRTGGGRREHSETGKEVGREIQ